MSRKRQITLYVLIGIFSGLGFVVKGTAVIMLIAIVITCFFLIRKRKDYRWVMLSIASCILIVSLFQIPYRMQIPRDIHEAHSFPYTHWVMMGLQNRGRVTWDDIATTMSFPTRAEKNANAIATIRYRLSEMGLRGYIALLGQKLAVLYSAPDFQPDGIIPFDNNPAAIRLGAMRVNNIFYIIYNAVVFYGISILAFVSIFLVKRNFTAYLAVFGVHMFFMLWEVNPRYLTNFFFVFIFLACLTIKSLIDERKFYCVNMQNCERRR